MSLKWYPPGQPVSYLDFDFRGGMLYSADAPLKWPGEPSAIQLAAPVGAKGADADADLGYYPSYESLTPDQRRSYLEWQAGGRRDADPGSRALGYVFLYFYGIERRICLDEDYDPRLLNELVGLLHHYGTAHPSRSFHGYFLSLLHYGSIKRGQDYYRSAWPALLGLDGGKTGEEPTKALLSNLFDLGEPLHWSIAFRLALNDPASRRSVVVSRAQDQFWTLFQTRYEGEFPDGIRLHAARQSTTFRHQPASAALLAQMQHGKRTPFEFKISNVLGMHTQFQRLSGIWNSCVDDLSGYSRAISSKKLTNAAGLKAWLELPEELRRRQVSPMQPFWDWVREHAPRENDFPCVAVSALAGWFGISERVKLSMAQSLDMTYALASMGWTIAPHPSHVDQAFAWSQEVVVYPLDDNRPVEPQIPGIVRLLYLMMPIAAADGAVGQEEMDTFHRFVSGEATHTSDIKYLWAVETALLRDTNLAVQALPAMARQVAPKNRESVLRVLVHIAAADGQVAPEELKLLRRVARAFDLPSEMPQDILRRDLTLAEVVIVEGKAGTGKGERIPKRTQEIKPGLVLDMNRITALTMETHEVVALLAEVMAEEPAPALPVPTPAVRTAELANLAWLDALDSRFHPIVVHIWKMDAIPMADFEALAVRHHLLLEDVINSINTWADETLGDFLLERSDPLTIYRTLLPSPDPE